MSHGDTILPKARTTDKETTEDKNSINLVRNNKEFEKKKQTPIYSIRPMIVYQSQSILISICMREGTPNICTARGLQMKRKAKMFSTNLQQNVFNTTVNSRITLHGL